MTPLAQHARGEGISLLRDSQAPGFCPISKFAIVSSARTMPEFRARYLDKTDPRNPLASPVFGDYRGIPPLLIQVGEHEMLRDDSVRVAKKARADGIPVTFEVWPGMVHVFQIRGLPESRQAIEQIAEFMRSKLPKP